MHMFDPVEILRSKSNRFDYNALTAPPLFSMIPATVDQYIYDTVIKSAYSIERKYEFIDKTMRDYGFYKMARGTNRSVYRSAFNESIVLKVGMDKYGAEDARHEYRNQEYLKPFCAKTFEVSPTGILGLFERVRPITHRDEIESIAEDIYDLLFNIISNQFVMADVGLSFFMNYGLRVGFGPVLLDYPYLYKMAQDKLVCGRRLPDGSVCDGLIDYDATFDYLECEKCGKRFLATDLAKTQEQYSTPFIFVSNGISLLENEEEILGMSQIYRAGQVVVSTNGVVDTPSKKQQSDKQDSARAARDHFAGETHNQYIMRKFTQVIDRFKDDNLSFGEIQNLCYVFLRTILMTDPNFFSQGRRLMDMAYELANMVFDRWETMEPPVAPLPRNNRGKSRNDKKRDHQHTDHTVPKTQKGAQYQSVRPTAQYQSMRPTTIPAEEVVVEDVEPEAFDPIPVDPFEDNQQDSEIVVLDKTGKEIPYKIHNDDYMSAVVNNAAEEEANRNKAIKKR